MTSKLLFTKKRLFKYGFTLVELMIAVSIFTVVMGFVLAMVVNVFRSSRQAQAASKQQQEMRYIFFRLNKEVNSITKSDYAQGYLKGDENSFFLPTPPRRRFPSQGINLSRQTKRFSIFTRNQAITTLILMTQMKTCSAGLITGISHIGMAMSGL